MHTNVFEWMRIVFAKLTNDEIRFGRLKLSSQEAAGESEGALEAS